MSKDDGLRGHFRTRMLGVHWQSIESAVTGGGIPDLNGCAEGVDFWIECKKTDAWKPEIKPAQSAWAIARIRMGGRVLLATRKRHDGGPKKGPACDELWIHSGMFTGIVKAGGLTAAPTLLVCSGGPGRWDWDQIKEVCLRAPLVRQSLGRSGQSRRG